MTSERLRETPLLETPLRETPWKTARKTARSPSPHTIRAHAKGPPLGFAWGLFTLLALIAMSAPNAAHGQSGPALAALRSLGVDTSRAAIPLTDVLPGGPPPQGIPALGFAGDRVGKVGPSPAPRFLAPDEIDWLADEEPVIALEQGGEARLYPLQILTWHEIVNDTLGGVPVAVTFCPLCNSALAFDRRVPLPEHALAALGEAEVTTVSLPEAFRRAYAAQTGEADAPRVGIDVTFGVSGLLYNSNLLMFDDITATLWSQLTGEAVVGVLTGTKLLRYPATILSYAEAKASYPAATVLSRDTGFARDYGRNPYLGYDAADSPPFLFAGPTDGRLPPKARVITLELAGEAVAYPFEVLERERVIHDEVGSDEAGKVPLVIFWQPGTRSALDAGRIAEGRDVGAAAVYERTLGDRVLTFTWDGAAFRDQETGSTWTLLGRAVSGPLEGAHLTPAVHDNTLWFAWAAFRPETRIYAAPPSE